MATLGAGGQLNNFKKSLETNRSGWLIDDKAAKHARQMPVQIFIRDQSSIASDAKCLVWFLSGVWSSLELVSLARERKSATYSLYGSINT